MDLFERLIRDHEDLLETIGKIEATTNPGLRRSLFSELKSAFRQHTRAEEDGFYARLAAQPETRGLIKEARHEHAAALQLFDEVETLDPGRTDWMARFIGLKESLVEHFDHEESVLFAAGRQFLGEPQKVSEHRR